MAKKKGNGEGTITKRKDGRWEARLTHGRRADGRPRRITVYGKTRKEVADRLNALLAAQNKGSLVAPDQLTFAVYLPQWLERKAAAGRKESTIAGYTNIIYRHLLPIIGERRVQSLEPGDFDMLYRQLREKGLRPRMVQLIHVVLSGALKQATRYGITARNVAELVDRPQAPAYTAEVWTGEQVMTFLDQIRSHRWFVCFYLAVTTGMRRGELLGLQWSDIDFQERRLTVQRNLTTAGRKVVMSEPKTKNGRRLIYLTQEALALLQEHRVAQEQQRAKLGAKWASTNHVFTTRTGTTIRPIKLSREFDLLGNQLGLPRIRLHDLRHTNASLAARQGMPLKVLSERLGHATPGFTAKTYQHLYDDQHREAALTLAELTGGRKGLPT
ncbi:hypothetical protein DKM44_14345 [Deinococcus irradiatisoli]|uniref:Site-specific integrase n=1 Tax=Deinococcus irradiatisoli TaxID=2202254 RepID=A0A2Z3JL38_9DEIO|nr:site-specific integrase [Deinococcus irradiatisoli]AWN24261.1 hypothetical protein DKM44_14345 [Deinococcus irradiatisoli]